jgi:pimeloyl-ACP methyl ester carboxylesterase
MLLLLYWKQPKLLDRPPGVAANAIRAEQQQALLAELLDSVRRHSAAMEAVSPYGHLGALHVPVLVLHGAGDNVIPAAEALWLARDIPSSCLREVLISPLITHVEVGGQPAWRDKLALVRFMAAMLKESESSR